MEMLLVGKITNTHGLRGDIKIYPYVTDKDEFQVFPYLIVEGEPGVKRKLKNVRFQKNMILAKLEGLDHINDAEKYKNKDVYVMKEDLPELEDGAFYVKDVLGYQVLDDEHGPIGTLKDVIVGSAQDVFVIDRGNGDDLMIPGVKEFILEFDDEEKILHVHTIEGMIE